MTDTTCFKTYDIRGKVTEGLTPELAFSLGQAVAAALDARSVVTGRDIRESSPALQRALADGLASAGVEVHDIGLCGTEEVYFATDHLSADAGIMVTASHNPIDYNGFKLVARGARPLSDEEFLDIKERVADFSGPKETVSTGQLRETNIRSAYVDRILSFVDPATFRPLRIVANAGNGAVGPTFDAIITELEKRGAKLDIIRVHHEPDMTFPNGIPNPLLPENHEATAAVVREVGADFGVAWDGDFDRCFFFDESGTFVPGEYIVGLLAKSVLEREPAARIVHDPRVIWNTRRIVEQHGGEPVVARTGHALMKEKMRAVEAAYGGEMSAHHYFRDFMYCDSGMIPLMLVLQLLSSSQTTLGEELAQMRRDHPSSGEINFVVPDSKHVIAAIEDVYRPKAASVCKLDGLSMSFQDWRFNLRASNTEPLLRLNLEGRVGDEALEQRREEITRQIRHASLAA